jgi:hypothetical protein
MTEELVRDLAESWLRGERIEVLAAVSQHLPVMVRADGPECAAVGLHEAAGLDDAWLVITAERLAVLHLRDNENAVLECPFEVPRFALESIMRWMPDDGPDHCIQVEFTDASWARLQTDEQGLRALTGPG